MAKRIAVINDDTTFLELMSTLLSDEGYEAHIFRESKSAYQGARDLGPDAIILDIRMESPATGWQMLELFKLDPVLARVPIIICSADISALQERAVHLQSKGCELLPKPFDLDDLLNALRRLVGRPDGEA